MHLYITHIPIRKGKKERWDIKEGMRGHSMPCSHFLPPKRSNISDTCWWDYKGEHAGTLQLLLGTALSCVGSMKTTHAVQCMSMTWTINNVSAYIRNKMDKSIGNIYKDHIIYCSHSGIFYAIFFGHSTSEITSTLR